jgi:hypothetical protein
MKYLLLPLVLVTGHVMGCPDDAGKNAMAPANGKAVATAQSTKTAPAAPATKAATKVATKPATEPRKTTPL